MRGKIFAIALAILFVMGIGSCSQLFENVDADESVVIQSPAGSLTWYITPGWKWQGFGKVTAYRKRSIYEINIPKMRFNDGAHGALTGSIQYEIPADEASLTELHIKFGSQEAIQNQLVKTIVDKAVYMSGSLMTSKESYAEKRNDLISFVEDQVENGVYQTRQTVIRQKDSISGVDKTTTLVEIVLSDGIPKRQEEAVLTQFGIKPFNFSISGLDYEDQVELQIQAQQQATMDVQTAMAQARKAEQDALTVEKQGEANAARAKWNQETIKATEVTKAQQEKEVAELAAQKQLAVAKLEAESAEQYRIRRLKEAEADATYKREVLGADGALAQKLEALVDINEKWAIAHANRKVPTTVLGGGGSNDSDTHNLMQLLTAKAAKDLALDMNVK